MLNQNNEAMKTTYLIFALFLVSFFQFISCINSDEENFPLEGTYLSIAEIAGDWTANTAFYYSVSVGSAEDYDVIEEGGAATLNIQTNGRFTLTMTIPGEGNIVYTGQLGFDEDLLVVMFDDEPDDWEYFGITLDDDDKLYISGPAEFDFNGDTIPEEAIVSFNFDRD